MLLLLLGIIVLHVTVLVLLFVSTIVSVSTGFPPAPGHWRGGERLAGCHGTATLKVLFLFVVYFPAWLLAGNLYWPFAGLSNSAGLEHLAPKVLSVLALSGVTGGSLGCVPERVLRASALVSRRAQLKPVSSSPRWVAAGSSFRAPNHPPWG